MTVPRRLRFALAALVALAGSTFFAAPALASTQPDPQLTNIPYLAWRGEEVRLVKCEPDIFPAGVNGVQAAQSVRFGPMFIDFLLVDWSGDPHLVQPQLEPGTVSAFFRSWDGAPCVAGTFISQKAGLAQIKLVATLNFSQFFNSPFTGLPEVITLKHDFNVGWMNINQASLSVVGGLTTDVAGGPGNDLQVLVNGTIPLLGNYGELGLGDHLTMPNDWAALANVMATFRDPLDPNPAMRWDIHDEFSPAGFGDDLEGHGHQSECPVFPIPEFFDAVDSCFFGGEEGAPFLNFSRVWDDFTFPTLGPFDPQRASQTLLSNGVLDAGDAPMPAARIDWAIARNSGAGGDISGVGSLFPRAKFRVYREDTDHAFDPGNPPTFVDEGNPIPLFYGPFYAQWIPPTYPSIGSFFGGSPPFFVPEASGITGPANFSRNPSNCDRSTIFTGVEEAAGGGNNFNGYLACGLYINWLFAKDLQCGPTGRLVDPNDPTGLRSCVPTPATPTGCLPLVADGSPSGADQPWRVQRTVVYTDEHGEARVQFVPGTEFFFTNLPGVGINANGGCDIANIPGNVLGSAAITATARYPFEPVTAQPVVSNTIVKTVTSLFSKTITCYPKGNQPEEHNAAICVAQATDITGAPFVDETVCFLADFNAEDIQHFVGSIPGTSITIPNTGRDERAEGNGLRRICTFTDEHGRAAVEVFNSNATTVNVTANFVDEGILRSIHVQFPIVGQQGPANGVRQSTPTNNPPGGGTTTPPGGGTTNPPGGGTGSPNPDANPGYDASDFRITKATLKRPKKQKPYMLVRVNGPSPTVRIRLTLTNRKGKALSRWYTSVETNKTVPIRGFKIAKNVRQIRIGVDA